MMNHKRRKSVAGVVFAGITAAAFLGVSVLGAPSAQGAGKHRHADDCKRVAAADRPVCRKVQGQHPYGASVLGKDWSAPNGRVLVHEITHQGYTKGEMGDALRAEARNYRMWVTHVPIDMDYLRRTCGSDGRVIVQFKDEDGKPGGVKLTQRFIECA